MNKIILITGATSGFGKAIAEKFAANNWDCVLTGRRADRLNELKSSLESSFNIKVFTLCFDVRNRDEVTNAIARLPEEWKNIDVLVNNAGLAAGKDTFDTANLDDWDTMIDTNIKGLLYVSKAIVPFMISNKKGHIINLGSVAGKEVYKEGNVYCATKFAVDALSQSQRIDLLPHRIKVTAVHPGAADTEFAYVRFKGDAEKAKAVYAGYEPLHAEDIANIAFYCSTLPDHVCINDLVVTCTAQASAQYFQK